MNRRAIGAAAAVAVATLIIAGCSSNDDRSAGPGTSTATVTKSVPPQSDPSESSGDATSDHPAHDTTPAGTDCSVPGGASATVSNAISRIAPPLPNNPAAGWQPGPSNLDGCRDLSYVALDTQGATASSPNQLLLFHKGQFLGTGTKCNLAYQRVTDADDTNVHVTYRYLIGDDISAHPSGRFDVTYRWTGSGVQMIGSIPPEVARDEC